MHVAIDFGLGHLDADVPDRRLVGVDRRPPAPPLADPVAAMREALEHPFGFPALRRALTPDDHVVVVLDEHLPLLTDLLAPVLEHVQSAGVAREAITILIPPGAAAGSVEGGLGDSCQDVRTEIHDPTERTRLSYLATTRKGRRLYLNRTAVDADQLVVLARRRFDPLLGYSGGEGAIYPALSDEATRKDFLGFLSRAVPGDKPWPAQQEATEVAWLLGAPFLVHVIEGPGESIVHVVSGVAGTGGESVRLLNARWRVAVDREADVVVVGVSGDPGRHTFADLAEAAACAARVVKPDGRIVVLSEGAPALGRGVDLLRQADSPAAALKLLKEHSPEDATAAFLWASASQRATIYLLSGLAGDVVEDLFAVPLEDSTQARRLLGAAPSCLFLPDANKTLAVMSNGHHP